MKKKLFLLAIMMIAVMSILVLSTSALEVEKLFAGDVIDLDEDEDLDTARTVLDNGDGTTSIYYTSQIGYVENDNYKTFKFDLTKITDKTYDVGDIIAIEIFEGPKCILKSISTTWTNLKYIKTSSTIDNIEEQAFASLTKLEIVDMSGSTSATALKAELFKNCSNLKKVILPPNVTSLGQWMFPNCTNLSEIYMPATITTISRNLHLSTTTSNFVIYFTGPYSDDVNSAIQILIAYSNVDASKITCVSAKDFNPNETSATQCTIVYDYSTCDAFYNGNHDYEGTGSCLDGVSCKVCNKTIVGASKHIFVETIEYENGFTKEGVYCKDCTNEGCTSFDIVDEVVKAIFTAKGYSYKLDTTNGHGIAGGYQVNHDALKKYQDVTGKIVEFGVVMFNVNSEQAQASTELFQNGVLTITQNAIQVSATSTVYSTITFKINGFIGNALDLELAIALYVNDIEIGENETKTYTTTFVQSVVTEDNKTATSGTYDKGGVNLSTVTCYSVSGTTPSVEQ